LLAYFSLHFAELQKNGDKEVLEAGADASWTRALHLHLYQADLDLVKKSTLG
jgi:hypothetical protein